MNDAPRHLQDFLSSLGLDQDPEVAGTAQRVTELLASFQPQPLPEPTLCAATSRSPVVVRAIPFHSLCAHHLLPFFGTVAIGYVPQERLLGLGTLPRAVAALARRTQLQERLADQLADTLWEWAQPISVAVGIRARHLCVEMRGAQVQVETLVVATRGEPDAWLRSKVEDP
jgi:GTP cyclohydrolase I